MWYCHFNPYIFKNLSSLWRCRRKTHRVLELSLTTVTLRMWSILHITKMTIKWYKYFLLSNFQNKCLAYNWNKFFIEYELEIEKHAWFYEVLHFTIWLFKCHKLFVKDLLTGIYRHTVSLMWNIKDLCEKYICTVYFILIRISFHTGLLYFAEMFWKSIFQSSDR